MALIKCTECGHDVSSLAATCPQCGAPIPAITQPIAPQRKTSTGAKIVGGVILVLAIVAFLSPKKETSPQEATKAEVAKPPVPEKPPELTEAEKAKKAMEDERDKRVATSAMHIKSGLRDPDSLVWEVFRSNAAGDLLCISYRAKNGFGGMNREQSVVVGTKISKTPANVKKYCKDAADMLDMKPWVETVLPYL